MLSVNLINVLRAAFARRSQNYKKVQLSHQYFFTLLGSGHIKGAPRWLMKLTPES